MPQVRLLKVCVIALVGLAFIWAYGCSDTNSDAVFDTDSGQHIGGNWIQDHGSRYLADPSQCVSCHGNDLMGGISKVSCYSVSFNGQSCHPGGPGGHPEGWADPDSHGAAAKEAPDGMTGFNVCQVCHGSYVSEGNSCYVCHTWEAPHSPAPWFSVSGGRTHTTTNEANAPVCALCHAGQSPTPAPPGTEPGCFNNTLCHGAVGHPEGWADPDSHGAAAKEAPDGMTGFNVCQVCHGSYVSEGNSCYVCHTWEAPHSPAPWFSASGGRTHTTTNEANAPVCALCHAGQSPTPAPPGTEPGCFNNTLCHGMLHPEGWADPASHGAAAKADPNGMTGFSSCQQCHGVDFSGAVALSCYDCHTWDAPHGRFPWLVTQTSNLTHITTAETNAPVCGQCHQGGSNSSRQPILAPEPGAPFGCYNNTLCHGREYSHDPSWTTDHALTARVTITVCQSCHGTDYRGGSSGVSCYRCHLGGPVVSDTIMHPSILQNNPVDDHPPYLRDLGGDATSCSPTAPSGANIAQYCHGVNLPQNPLLVTPPNGSWTPFVSCYLCHGKEWTSP